MGFFKRKGTARNKRAQRAAQAFGDEMILMPVLGGPRDERRAISYLGSFLEFEQWIEEGRRPLPDADRFPFDFQILLQHWPEALEFYRHSLFIYIERLLAFNPWSMCLRSVLVRLQTWDPEGFDRFIETAWGNTARFRSQSKNALTIMREQPDGTDSSRNLRDQLTAYNHMYEIDYLLWFLGVIGRGLSTGRVEADAFGGPETTTPQSSLIAQVLTALSGTPLEAFFFSAYDPVLRNSVAHNNYEIQGKNSDFSITDRESGTVWSSGDIFILLDNSIRLMAACISGAFAMKEVFGHAAGSDHVSAGILHTSHGYLPGNPPNAICIYVMQLWCYRDIDPSGQWLDESTVSIDPSPDPQPHPVKFSKDTGRFGTSDRWAHIVRVPIAPAFGLEFPEFYLGNGLSYEVVGPPDEHMIPFVDFED